MDISLLLPNTASRSLARLMSSTLFFYLLLYYYYSTMYFVMHLLCILCIFLVQYFAPKRRRKTKKTEGRKENDGCWATRKKASTKNLIMCILRCVKHQSRIKTKWNENVLIARMCADLRSLIHICIIIIIFNISTWKRFRYNFFLFIAWAVGLLSLSSLLMVWECLEAKNFIDISATHMLLANIARLCWSGRG